MAKQKTQIDRIETIVTQSAGRIDHIEETVDVLARTIASGFDEMHKKFGLIDKNFGFVGKQLTGMAADLQEVKDGQARQGKRLDDIDVVLRGVLRAVDKDSVQVMNHERRIAKLERAR